jgi:hypothetical protein
MTGPTIRHRPEPPLRRRSNQAQPLPLIQDSATLARPDRPDCARRPLECRSPYACASVNCCADTLTPGQDSRIFGYGDNGGRKRRT